MANNVWVHFFVFIYAYSTENKVNPYFTLFNLIENLFHFFSVHGLVNF